ncbi:sugar transferase [Alkalibacillus almallahensis]|uniref:sugar transferase n=1 Tax=Alkalibacillus almallahensis TaxID=1379154 RepID=UPI002444DB30|nr:sugar transferase [Alkalibacillus almallahensis]NIK11800.1 lipopolysaccharide/colanic/teichoic acid biosynthesis glycosyltransferase [Alkalibacillus almallahensis]
MKKNSMYNKRVKRFVDFTVALISIFILSPILISLAILVKVKIGSPVLFKQKRPGLNETIFTMYKFRTMTNEKDSEGELLSDDDRLTKFGKFLRSTSFDELPELINITKGDMSIVGPRPQLVKDMVFMTDAQRERHELRPGLTGWAQINGRNSVTWEDKLSLDLEYLKEQSWSLDLKIVLITAMNVFKREGISSEGMETAEDLGDYLLREDVIDIDEYYAKIVESNRLIDDHKAG